MSRAAVVAGALTGCASASSPPPSTTTTATTTQADEVRYRASDPASAVSIAGVITDQHSLRPLVDVMVELRDEQPIDDPSVRTDADGRYQFDRVPPGRYTLVFHGGGHPGIIPTRREITVEPGKVTHVDVMVRFDAPNRLKAPYGAPPARRRIV